MSRQMAHETPTVSSSPASAIVSHAIARRGSLTSTLGSNAMPAIANPVIDTAIRPRRRLPQDRTSLSEIHPPAMFAGHAAKYGRLDPSTRLASEKPRASRRYVGSHDMYIHKTQP